MLDSRFMPLVIWVRATETPKVVDVATRDKTTMLYLRVILLFTLQALLNAIVCCLQLNTERGADANRKVDY